MITSPSRSQPRPADAAPIMRVPRRPSSDSQSDQQPETRPVVVPDHGSDFDVDSDSDTSSNTSSSTAPGFQRGFDQGFTRIGEGEPPSPPRLGQLDDDLAARMRPSKTQLKKEMHDLQALGEALVELPPSRIQTLELSETLLIALRDYRQTRSHEARRRQMQYIGKLMRHTDPAPIREAVAAMQLGSAKETLALHRIERLRVELIESDDALTRWLEEHPDTDAQQLRSLIRAARKDAAQAPEQRNGRAYRELFQFIKQSREDDGEAGRPGGDGDGPDHDEAGTNARMRR